MKLLTKLFGKRMSIVDAARMAYIEMPDEFHSIDFIRSVRRKIHNNPLDTTILRTLRLLRGKGCNWECVDYRKSKYKKI